MTSTRNDVVVDALSAIRNVADRVVVDTEEGNPDKEDVMRLMRSAASMVRWRRDAAVPMTIDTIANVVRIHPWTFVDEVEHSILLGLQRLVDDTAINRHRGTKFQEEENRMEVSTKLHIRQEAARLAYNLFEYYGQRGRDIPRAVLAWEQICRTEDEFAEIRNQWPYPMPAAC